MCYEVRSPAKCEMKGDIEKVNPICNLYRIAHSQPIHNQGRWIIHPPFGPTLIYPKIRYSNISGIFTPNVPRADSLAPTEYYAKRSVDHTILDKVLNCSPQRHRWRGHYIYLSLFNSPIKCL